MSDTAATAAVEETPASPDTTDAPAKLDLSDSISEFVGNNPDYYNREFKRLQVASGFTFSFNVAAALAGPLWAGSRSMWGIFCILAMFELLALVPIGQGLWGDLGAAEQNRVEKLYKSVERMQGKLEKAQADGNTEKVESLTRNLENLNGSVDKAEAKVVAAKAEATFLIAAGIIGFLMVKLLEGAIANMLYEKRYARWRVDRSLGHGFSWIAVAASVVFVTASYGVTMYRFTAPEPSAMVVDFPVDQKEYHDPTAKWIDDRFEEASANFGQLFKGVSKGIRIVLEWLEVMFVVTPWPVVMTIIFITAWRLAGPTVAIFTLAALVYLAILGYWERSMATVALLGTAAAFCVLTGIPLGVWCAKSDKLYAVVRPVLDFMQSMPAFVYLIPVIAFFGVGKPPGIVASIVFGFPPIVRLTNLGLRSVPHDVKEAAMAFGATKWQILKDVETPLAMPSIMAGVNQTILFCLSAVVIASLIGAEGLGFDVLVALQYAAKGQGVLAGLAILFCAMVIDRIVQGFYRRQR